MISLKINSTLIAILVYVQIAKLNVIENTFAVFFFVKLRVIFLTKLKCFAYSFFYSFIYAHDHQ